MTNVNLLTVQERATPEQPQYFFSNKVEYLNQLLELAGKQPVSNTVTAYDAFSEWAQGDHTRPDSPINLSGSGADQAQEIYEHLDMIEERSLPAGDYDDIVLLGGIYQSTKRRVGYLSNLLNSDNIKLKPSGRIVVWAGERNIYPEDEAELVASDLAAIKEDSVPAWIENAPVLSETLLARLALKAETKLGNTELRKLYLRLNDPNPLSHYELSGQYPIMLLHTKATKRTLGAPRHSTETCAADWLNIFQPRTGSRVAFISSNPFIDRTTRVVRRVMSEQGRKDISISGGGTAAMPTTPDSVFLGEIARNLYEDLRASRA